ncbi:MAG: hypothetical protein WD845_14300 [Pirellulales bacterium]
MHSTLRLLSAAAPIVLVALVLVFGMLANFPADDDVLLEYLITLQGPDQMYDAHLDRPVLGVVWRALARHDALWSSQVVANFISWLTIAAMSAWLYQWVFPDSRRMAVAAGLFAVSPLFIETHFIIANSCIPVHALSQLPILLLLADYRRPVSYWAALCASLLAIIAAALVSEYSEYAVATTGGVSVLLLAKAYFASEPLVRRRALTSFVLLAGAALATYAVFVAIRDPDFRPGVDTSNLASDGLARVIKLPFRLVSAIYTGTIGALLRELAVLNVNTKETIVGALFGLVLAAMAVLSTRSAKSGEGTPRPFGGYAWPVLLTAFAVALIPALVMGRRPDDYSFSSRFFFPALPMASVLTVAFFRQVIAGHREWVVVAIIGFVAGYASLSEALAARAVNREMIAWGETIRPYVDEKGTTVAVVLLGKDKFDGSNLADDLLTTRIGWRWPVELRRRFYATNSLDELGPSESSARRGAHLEYPITRVLLVMPKGIDNGVTVTEIDRDHLPKQLVTGQP